MTAIPELSRDEFQEVVTGAKRPVVAEFFTRSCVPCKRIEPLLEELRRDFSNELTVVKMDIEKHPDVAAKYDVASVPTLLVFQNGGIGLRIVGVVSKKDLVRVIHENPFFRKPS